MAAASFHAAARADSSSPADREALRAELVEVAVAAGDKVWQKIAATDPEPTLSCRVLFSSALTLCEARLHPERLDRLFQLAESMQDGAPESAGFGNFHWYWRDTAVTDANAVEFCSYDMHLIWRLHREWLPDSARESLRRILDRAVDGCLRHRVRPSYTNIATLNAANLITLGEALRRPDAAAEGYRRLDAMAADTWQFGLHEYCSPTYYAIDVQALALIERFAERDSGRTLAGTLLTLVWTDIALNFFPAGERLAGSHSRSYDYLRGLGGLQQDLRWEGWTDVPAAKSTEVLHVAQGRWSPPPRLLEMARTRWPRLVRQSWGPSPAETRTHWLLADVTLGCSGASYGAFHDCPLTIDFAGRPGSVRGYFIADGREDPYGRSKFGTGAAKHPKALHLEPFWAGAQREADALGLVVYRDADLKGPETVNLQSHFVLPRDVEGIWIAGKRQAVSGTATATPTRTPVAIGDPLVIRKGSAAVGLRVIWARAQDGAPADAALVEDGHAVGALRLTVEHRRSSPTAEAGAALWVRVGGGLDDDAKFTTWRESFERAVPERVEATPQTIRLAVPGRGGPVAISADAPFASSGRVLLEPAPSRAVLELDGLEIGRPLLETVEPFASFAMAFSPARIVHLPQADAVPIEAENGLVLPRMEVGADDRGVRFVWQPDASPRPATAGSVTLRIRVAAAGRYWLWGRVLGPDADHDSFSVAVSGADGAKIVEGAWHVPRSSAWRWAAVAIGGTREPTPLDLPRGDVQLTIFAREPGTRLDKLWLTSEPGGRPEVVGDRQ